jgi:hypothetical protein
MKGRRSGDRKKAHLSSQCRTLKLTLCVPSPLHNATPEFVLGTSILI